MIIRFAKGLKTWLTKNFRKRELDCNCKIDHETITDRLLIDGLQKIREHFGRRCDINSGHRCQIYNDQLPNSSRNSNHVRGMAADIDVDGVDPRLVAAYAASLGLRVGFYKTFTHVDITGGPHFIGKY